MRKLTYAIIAFLTILCVPLSAQTAEKKPTVVIVPFEAKSRGIEQDDCEIVTESFESEYARTGSALVVNRNTLRKIQTEQAFQNSDWSNNDKTAKLGEALNAQQLVFGSLRLYNDILFVTIQIQDITTLAVLASVNVRVKDTMELLDKIPSICSSVIAQLGGTIDSVKNNETSDKNYKIGDIGPGGGYIFYYSISGFPVYSGDKMTVCHYLECSPDLVGDKASWCPCPEKTRCNVNTDTGIGAGKKNTENILSANHSGKPLYAYNCAAKACAEYSTKTTKEGEWYLPSLQESYLIYETLRKSGKIVSDAWHWSSSQNNDKYALVQRFSNGYSANDYKYRNNCVRAVRAF